MVDNAELDAKLAAAAKASGEDRAAAYREIAQYAYDQELVIPVAALQGLLLTSDRIAYEADGFTDIELHLSDVKHKQ